MDVRNENHNNASDDRSPGTYKGDGEIQPKDPGQHPNQRLTVQKI